MSDPVLAVCGLQKRFGRLTAVDGLDLEVREGEILGLLGPNGAGKTTSIRMMAGLLAPDAGRIFLRGQQMAGGTAEVRARVGVCPQEVVLWAQLTCEEQLAFMGELYGLSRREASRRGSALLESLGLADKRLARARTLSGGMQRRLNLALSLVHDPEMVVLDEPEAGLDPQSRRLVRDFIRGLARQKTVLLTTHNLDEADRIADRVAILDHGRLLLIDTPEALRRRVGGGDVIELALRPEAEAASRARAVLGRMVGEAAIDAGPESASFRALDAVGLLPRALTALREAGLEVTGVRIRPNTLEDVFLALTGRELRA